MSERRTILSRPRTKVYESNYNIGESYYKPMVDHLDRKYSGRPLFPSPPREFHSPRRALDEEFLRDPLFDRSKDRTSQIKDDFFEKANSAAREADAFFDRHGRRTEAESFLDKTHSLKSEAQEFFDKAVSSKAEESFAEKSQNLRNKADAFIEKARSENVSSRTVIDDEVDDAVSAQLKRIKASRLARDDDLDFATNAISSASDSQAQLKARQSQIRVTNINAELSAIQERTEARAKRLAEIKNLMAENDALSSISHAVHDRNTAIHNRNSAFLKTIAF